MREALEKLISEKNKGWNIEVFGLFPKRPTPPYKILKIELPSLPKVYVYEITRYGKTLGYLVSPIKLKLPDYPVSGFKLSLVKEYKRVREVYFTIAKEEDGKFGASVTIGYEDKIRDPFVVNPVRYDHWRVGDNLDGVLVGKVVFRKNSLFGKENWYEGYIIVAENPILNF